MKALRKDTRQTRQQLIDAAERLFAERGIENVTLLDIGKAAGQKNRNAPQYHFGDKAELINAVLNKHTDLIAGRRRVMLDALADTARPTIRQLVDVLVLPVSDHVASRDNSSAFLIINAQLMTSPAFRDIGEQRAGRIPEVVYLQRLFAKALPDMNKKRLQTKLVLVMSMLYHGLASFRCQQTDKNHAVFVDILCRGIEELLLQDEQAAS